MIQNITVIGVGGVGGYFGGKLCRLHQDSQMVRVSFVARGAHLRAIQTSGLLLSAESEGDMVCKPTLATDNIADLPSPDLCLLCVKEFDLPSILVQLKPLIRDETIILPLLNGVDIYARIRKVVSEGVVLPACVYVGTHVERPGKVTQKGGACKILFGPDPERTDFAPQELVALFGGARIKCEFTENVQSEIWTKFIFICGYGLVTAAADATLGEVLQNKERIEDVRAIMLEAAAVARALHVSLPDNIVESALARAHNFPTETKTSFQRDFEQAGKLDERDLFAGAVIHLASKHGVQVPRIQEFSAELERIKPRRTSKAESL